MPKGLTLDLKSALDYVIAGRRSHHSNLASISKKMVWSGLLSRKYNNEISLMENALSDLFCTDYSSITLGKNAIPQ